MAGKNDGWKILAAIIIVLGGLHLYAIFIGQKGDKAIQKALSESFDNINLKEFLDTKDDIQKSLINTINELHSLLQDSIKKYVDNKEQQFRFPVATGMLMRTAYELSIKIFLNSEKIESDNILAKNEEIMMSFLDEKEEFRLLKEDLSFLMENDVRSISNGIVHEPADVETIIKHAKNMSTGPNYLRFINGAVKHAHENAVKTT